MFKYKLSKEEISAIKSRCGKLSKGKHPKRPASHYRAMSAIGWAKIKRPLAERFWSKITKGSSNECWEWNGCLQHGYGMFSIENRTYVASRLAFEFTYSILHPPLCALHQCDNRKCCNPDHLFVGTRTVNHADMMEKGRHVSLQGEASGMAVLKTAQVIEMRQAYSNGERQCSLARRFGCSKGTVAAIIHRRNWKHI